MGSAFDGSGMGGSLVVGSGDGFVYTEKSKNREIYHGKSIIFVGNGHPSGFSVSYGHKTGGSQSFVSRFLRHGHSYIIFIFPCSGFCIFSDHGDPQTLHNEINRQMLRMLMIRVFSVGVLSSKASERQILYCARLYARAGFYALLFIVAFVKQSSRLI